MPTALATAEVVAGVLALLALGFLLGTYARRRTISRGATLLVLCGWRPDAVERWRLGHLRLGSSRLEWFALLGVSTRPVQGWDRVGLDLQAPRRPRREDLIDLLPDAAPVPCRYGDERFELGLTPQAYTAVRSWAEAAPPGSAARVA